jgi:hypothetical protein
MTAPRGKLNIENAHREEPARRGITLLAARILVLALLIAGTAAGALAAPQDDVAVNALVEKQDVYLGESFIYRIQVIGGRRVDKPDLSDLEDFDAREIPRSWVRMRNDGDDKEEGTLYYYRLSALKTGSLDIPPVQVSVDGKSYETSSVSMQVTLPPPSDEFKLELSLSKERVYVGEPVVLSAVWYFLKEARYYYSNLPILRHPGFRAAGKSERRGTARIYVRTSDGSHFLSGKSGTAMVDGTKFYTLTYEQVLVPEKAGSYDFLPGTVQVWWQKEGDRRRNFRDREYQSAVVASGRLDIRVLPLPEKGKPADFSGIISDELRISAGIEPDIMNVGDPVTLSLALSGPPALEDAGIPAFEDITELTEHFTIKDGPMQVSSNEDSKVFSKTVRVRNESVDEVPAVGIVYFNTETESYTAARSRPVPITVRPTRRVTSSDLEGEDLPGRTGTTVRNLDQGIRFNYHGVSGMLERKPLGIGSLAGHPAMLLLLLAPTGLLAAALIYGRRHGWGSRNEPEQVQQEPETEAFQRLARRLETDREQLPGQRQVLGSWREYLLTRLRLAPGRFIPQEVDAELSRLGLEPGLLKDIRDLLSRYDLYTYQGGMHGPAADREPADRGLIEQVLRTARGIEESISSDRDTLS